MKNIIRFIIGILIFTILFSALGNSVLQHTPNKILGWILYGVSSGFSYYILNKFYTKKL